MYALMYTTKIIATRRKRRVFCVNDDQLRPDCCTFRIIKEPDLYNYI